MALAYSLYTQYNAPIPEYILWKRQGNRCFYCGEEMLPFGDGMRCASRDHLLSTGHKINGQNINVFGNTVLAHKQCNMLKSDRPPTPEEIIRAAKLYEDYFFMFRMKDGKPVMKWHDHPAPFLMETIDSTKEDVIWNKIKIAFIDGSRACFHTDGNKFKLLIPKVFSETIQDRLYRAFKNAVAIVRNDFPKIGFAGLWFKGMMKEEDESITLYNEDYSKRYEMVLSELE